MAQAKTDLDLEEDFVVDAEPEDAEAKDTPTAKTNLAKRRVIDNMLEERRLKKQLSDYDFDL
ncbi:PA3496 family putative envelope integrity protein [Pseudomonas sp. GCM10022188]|uniref:PA3496 family putative envelope integrity protein n=1 Tax=Pseudomonas TaxID=286 RepID=UPI001E4D093E|nr:hypothetical protein [Pseudomonas oryzagri]MCC6073548.1 hypothetical protein [Pseudomonas oryzagri]